MFFKENKEEVIVSYVNFTASSVICQVNSILNKIDFNFVLDRKGSEKFQFFFFFNFLLSNVRY